MYVYLLGINYCPLLQSLEDVIQLKSKMGSKDQVKEKFYSYSQLKELQSKLTLVAGEQQKENKETIQRFETVSSQARIVVHEVIDF